MTSTCKEMAPVLEGVQANLKKMAKGFRMFAAYYLVAAGVLRQAASAEFALQRPGTGNQLLAVAEIFSQIDKATAEEVAEVLTSLANMFPHLIELVIKLGETPWPEGAKVLNQLPSGDEEL
jgi:hypothetical protein